MSFQDALFREHLDPIKLKEGKAKCPCCNRRMKAYGYELNQPLIKVAFTVLAWTASHQTIYFDPREVFAEYSPAEYKQAFARTTKLAYHNIFERQKKVGQWKLTRAGYHFLKGNIQLPRKVWVFNRTVVLRDDARIFVREADPEWKTERQHWALDYVLQKYQTQYSFGRAGA